MSRPQRVCLDLTPTETRDRFGGFSRYGLALLEHLLAIAPADRADIDLVAIARTDGPVVPAIDLRARDLLNGPLVAPDRHARQRRHLDRALCRGGVDLFHALYPEALPRRRGFKIIASVNDLVTDTVPNTGDGPLRRLGRRIERWWEYRAADHLIAISETTRQDARRIARVPAHRIDVVWLGVDAARFTSAASRARRQADGGGVPGLPERYVVSVGSDHYRKNQWRVYEAWQQAAERTREGLVLVGRQIYGDVFSRISSDVVARTLGGRVVWLPEVDDDALPALYRGASALVAPSLYEGFGMTLLEAMACGTPVIASTAPAHMEVAGDAALYFDPLSAADLSSVLVRLSRDADLQGQLRSRGLERVRQFTWTACARRTLEVYRKVLAM